VRPNLLGLAVPCKCWWDSRSHTKAYATRDACTIGAYDSGVSISLCCLLWARPGQHEGLIAYEDRVLELVSEHGGRILQRARTDGSGDQPLEIQVFTFESQSALDGYMNDERRLALADERDRVVARTELMHVTLNEG
jgi:uncharacterized protein (DUF1330 family)